MIFLGNVIVGHAAFGQHRAHSNVFKLAH
jgi:hypothetical protein